MSIHVPLLSRFSPFCDASPAWLDATGILLSLRHSWTARQACTSPAYTYRTLAPHAPHHFLAEPMDYDTPKYSYMYFQVDQDPHETAPLQMGAALGLTVMKELKDAAVDEKVGR